MLNQASRNVFIYTGKLPKTPSFLGELLKQIYYSELSNE